jgi:aspartyl-tRNA(Asn)/glutamyl-tRNA(Gln) amidotransferase subunit A
MTHLPLTIKDAARALRAGEITSVELTRTLIARADRLDPVLGCFITRMDDQALAAAAQADADFAAGIDKGPLQGIPVGVKDILATDDAPTTAQSLAMDPEWPKQGDGPAVKRLRQAGAVIVGKNTTNEFASGAPDDQKPFPIPKNPWDPDRSPGGSSSGTGVGVAAGLPLGGVGTDTSGSVRWPAAANGVSGMMATYGRVPKSGVTQNGFSLDHVGPLARTAWDCAAMLTTMAGHDPSDECSIDVPVPDYTAGLDGSFDGLRVGVVRDGFSQADGVHPDTVAAFEAAVGVFESGGARVSEVVIPHIQEIFAAQFINNASEKSGIYVKRFERQWLDWGRYTRVAMSSFGLFFDAADYVQSLRVRQWAKRTIAQLMLDYDVLLTPTMKGPAGLRAGVGYAKSLDSVILTSPWSWIGYPAIAIPMGFSAGLPLSLQVAGKPFDEPAVFKAADAYQQATSWHLQVPPALADLEPPLVGEPA